MIDDLVNRLLSMGMDFGTKDAVRSGLQFIGADTASIDMVYIELKNKLNKTSFSKIPYSERTLFLPQCLRNSEHCPSKLMDKGFVCEECGSCSICEMKTEAEKLGYKVHIVPGGSMVFKIIKANNQKGYVGVACYFELVEAFEQLTAMNLPFQGVPLLRDGCKDTVMDVEKVLAAIRM